MENTQVVSDSSKGKKLVDLIYLDQYQTKTDLKEQYKAKIKTWLEWMDNKLEKVASTDVENQEQNEYFVANHLLRNFLNKRYRWILDASIKENLRYKYWLVLPPFNQKGGIRSFLTHFFMFRETSDSSLEYANLNNSEREVRILWDIYKLTKTLETISVLEKSIKSTKPFSSRFSKDYIASTLSTMAGLLNLLIKICVKPENQEDLRFRFPPGVFNPETILHRKETKNYLINHVTLEKYDYRNYFFHIYFKSSMKASFKGRDLKFQYNYLDFEIMRQEFLMDWLQTRLKNSPKKLEVMDRYMLGKKTFSEVVESNPAMEIPLLRKLPNNVFNDLMADLDEAVDPEEKSGIDPMSENSGAFSEQFKLFGFAKELTQKTTQAIKETVESIKKTASKTLDVFTSGTGDEPAEENNSRYQIKILKADDIDFPFFSPDESRYGEDLARLHGSIQGDQFNNFEFNIENIISNAGEENLLKRITPRNEVVLPCLIKEKSDSGIAMQILVAGIETREKMAAKGSESGDGRDFDFLHFYVYGSKDQNHRMGEPTEERSIMGKPFFIYKATEPQVKSKAMLLLKIILDEVRKK